MIREETKKLLVKIQVGDNRQVDQLVIEEWHQTVGHLGFEECWEAVVMHRQESPDWLMPAHVIRNVQRVRAARQVPRHAIEESGPFPPKPANFEAMCAAWNDPVAWAREVHLYDEQLRAAGFPSLQDDRRRV